jgi:hypothetical protein
MVVSRGGSREVSGGDVDATHHLGIVPSSRPPSTVTVQNLDVGLRTVCSFSGQPRPVIGNTVSRHSLLTETTYRKHPGRHVVCDHIAWSQSRFCDTPCTSPPTVKHGSNDSRRRTRCTTELVFVPQALPRPSAGNRPSLPQLSKLLRCLPRQLSAHRLGQHASGQESRGCHASEQCVFGLAFNGSLKPPQCADTSYLPVCANLFPPEQTSCRHRYGTRRLPSLLVSVPRCAV